MCSIRRLLCADPTLGSVPALSPDRSQLLLDVGTTVMPTVFQTLDQALGGTEVSLEEPALPLGSPRDTSKKSYRGQRKEVSVDWAFKSSQNDEGEASRRQIVLQMPNLKEECLE